MTRARWALYSTQSAYLCRYKMQKITLSPSKDATEKYSHSRPRRPTTKPTSISRPNDFALQTCVFFYAVTLPPPSFLALLPVNSSSCGCFNLLKQPKTSRHHLTRNNKWQAWPTAYIWRWRSRDASRNTGLVLSQSRAFLRADVAITMVHR